MQATSLPAVTIASTAVAVDVDKLAAAVIDAAKSRGKCAREFRAAAEHAYADKVKQDALSVTLGQIRHVINQRQEAVAKRMGADDRDVFKKAVINQLAYATKVAGDTAGCRFVWDQSSKTYAVRDLPAAGEKSKQTAAGKDEKSAEQSEALARAAEAAHVLRALDRQGHLMGICANLIEAGYTMAEIEAAYHATATRLAAEATAKEIAEAAQKPMAPELLAQKLADGMGANVKSARAKRSQKALANVG